jgi:zinc protease
MPVDRSALPMTGPERPFAFPAIARHVLPNGLDLRAVTHRAVPVASIVLLVPGGSSADPADRPGIASLTADMLDEGANGRDALALSDALAMLGAELDVEVGPDATFISLTTLSRFLRPALDLLADMALRPALTDADFTRVRQLRLERLRQLRDQPSALAERAFARAVYGAHPYGHLGLGSESSLRATTVDDVRDFHRRAFGPAGATLVVAADLPAAELMDACTRAFGAWASPLHPVASDGAGRPLPAPADDRLAVVSRAGAAQSELRVGHACATRNTPDYHALVLLNAVLGGQFVSRLNLNLREKRGLTYGVRSAFDLRKGIGPFVVSTSVQSNATDVAVGEIHREIRDIAGPRPVTAEELSLARASVTLGYPRGFETAQQVARGVAQLALYGLPDDYFERFVPAAHAVGLDDLARVAATYLQPDALSTIVVGDRDVVAPALARAGFGTAVEPQGLLD